MRLYSLCFIIHLLAAETNSEQIQIHGTTLCDTKEAEQAIKELHDDLDDDDDGTISTTGNFINIQFRDRVRNNHLWLKWLWLYNHNQPLCLKNND